MESQGRCQGDSYTLSRVHTDWCTDRVDNIAQSRDVDFVILSGIGRGGEGFRRETIIDIVIGNYHFFEVSCIFEVAQPWEELGDLTRGARCHASEAGGGVGGADGRSQGLHARGRRGLP